MARMQWLPVSATYSVFSSVESASAVGLLNLVASASSAVATLAGLPLVPALLPAMVVTTDGVWLRSSARMQLKPLSAM